MLPREHGISAQGLRGLKELKVFAKKYIKKAFELYRDDIQMELEEAKDKLTFLHEEIKFDI